MKSFKKIAAIAAVVLSAQFSFAQVEQDYANLVKDAIKLEAKNHIYSSLQLTPEETKAFDPLFDQYLKAQGKVAEIKWQNFDKYLSAREQYSTEKLDNLNQSIWKANSEQVKLNKKYYKKFKKAIGVEKATYFFFVKRYLDNAVEYRKLEFLRP